MYKVDDLNDLNIVGIQKEVYKTGLFDKELYFYNTAIKILWDMKANGLITLSEFAEIKNIISVTGDDTVLGIIDSLGIFNNQYLIDTKEVKIVMCLFISKIIEENYSKIFN